MMFPSAGLKRFTAHINRSYLLAKIRKICIQKKQCQPLPKNHEPRRPLESVHQKRITYFFAIGGVNLRRKIAVQSHR